MPPEFHSAGQNRLGLRGLCERYVNDQWFAADARDELAAEALLDWRPHDQ